MRVRETEGSGKTLFWPANLAGRASAEYRGRAGYVVDWTLPWERDWCKGQEYKLEPAPDDAEPSKITLKQAIKEIQRLNGTVPEPPKTVQKQKAENAAAAPEPDKSEVPPVAPPPKKENS